MDISSVNTLFSTGSFLQKNALRTSLDAQDSAAAASQTERKETPVQNLKARLKKIQDVRSEAISTRKALARARMALLKQQIEALQKLAGSGAISPHMIASLVRELKSLVAQYGGSDGSVSLPSTSSDGAVSAAPDASTEVAVAAIDPSAESVPSTDEVSVPDEAAVVAVAASSETSQPAATATTGSAIAATDGKSILAGRQGSADDANFFAEVKKLAQQLKMLLSMQRKPKNILEQQDLKKAQKEMEGLDEVIAKAEGSVANEAAEGQSISNELSSADAYSADGLAISVPDTPQISASA